MFAPLRSVYLVLALTLCRPVRQQIAWTRAKERAARTPLAAEQSYDESVGLQVEIVGAFVFPEFWENSSDVPSNLAALRDVGVNAIAFDGERQI